jgi:cation transport regulator
MPYDKNDDLPQSIRDNLPEHAQTIFRKAFNSALKQYGEEERAFKIAWAAVKREYEKNSKGKWVKRDS